jgi:phospholipid-translocating ATPase
VERTLIACVFFALFPFSLHACSPSFPLLRFASLQVGFFRALQRLILVHGRYSYYRTSLIAQYSFYKSFLFCFIQIGYGFYSGFAGVSLFNSLCTAAYNAVLFVPIVYFMLDRDLCETTALRFPKSYRPCQRGELMNYTTMGKVGGGGGRGGC